MVFSDVPWEFLNGFRHLGTERYQVLLASLLGTPPQPYFTFNSANWTGPANDTLENGILPDTCQFKAFREHDPNAISLEPGGHGGSLYPRSKDYFTVLMAKFGFVLLFQVHYRVNQKKHSML